MTLTERPVADSLFPGLRLRDVATSGARIHVRVGGTRPALPLLRGYPQTHALRHEVAIVGPCFDPLALRRELAQDARGRALPGGHHLAEEVPDLVAAEFQAFFGAAA